MFRKKWMSAFILLTALSTLIAACSGVDNNNKEPVTKLTVVMPGDQSARMKEFWQNEFNERMRKELNIEFSISYIPWAQYFDKLTLMMTSGEPLDFFWGGNTVNMLKFIQTKGIIPVNELLDKHGPNLKKYIPKHAFKAVTTSDGKIWGISGKNVPSSSTFTSFLVREDLLKDVGMTDIKTIQDLTDFGVKFKAKYPDQNFIMQDGFIKTYIREFAPKDIDMTTFGPNEMLYINEKEKTGTIYSMFENEALMRQISKLRADWKAKGFFTDAQLTDYENSTSHFRAGKLAVTTGAITRALEYQNEVQKSTPNAVLTEYLLHPERPRYIVNPATDNFFITRRSKNPEAVIKWLNWVYESKENHDFIVYGAKDKDYKLDGERVVPINKDVLFYDWMFMDMNFFRFQTNVPQKTIDAFKGWDEGAQTSKMLGFVFNNEKVKSEEARIQSVYLQKVFPILAGFASFDQYYPEAVKALKDAGIDKYRAEYENQFKEFLASQ
jgi:putative aldouronate transport system substrate-binding protein